MKHKAVKIGLTSVVLAMTFGLLLYTTMAEGVEYYKHVDEVMAQPDQWYGKKLQLHGFVASAVCGAEALASHPCVIGKSMLLRHSEPARRWIALGQALVDDHRQPLVAVEAGAAAERDRSRRALHDDLLEVRAVEG